MWDPSKQPIPPPHILYPPGTAGPVGPHVPPAPSEPLDPEHVAHVRTEHDAWLTDRYSQVCRQLDEITDPVERFLQATICGAQVSTRPQLPPYVAHPPAAASLARYFAAHAEVEATTQILVEEKTLWGYKSTRKLGWVFREGSDAYLPHGHGENRYADIKILTTGELIFGHQDAQGSGFQYETLREMAQMCGLVDSTQADRAAPAKPPTAGQPPLTALDEIINNRRNSGQHFDVRRF